MNKITFAIRITMRVGCRRSSIIVSCPHWPHGLRRRSSPIVLKNCACSIFKILRMSELGFSLKEEVLETVNYNK
jgi:hypothetical protein